NRTPPPPTSPVPETDGDDLCRIDVTDMAIDGVTLLVCLIGLVGNGAVLWILVLRIRKNPITVYFRSLAFINFIFLLFMAISSLLYMIENASCSANLPTLSLSSLSQLSLFSYNTVAYLLTAISIERCVSILFPLWYRYRRPQYFSDVMCDLCWFFSIIFFAVATSLCLSHKHDLEHCRMALISMYVLNFLVFAPLMVISSTILFIKVLCASQQRQLRRLYIVIFLTVPLFIILEVPWNFQQQFLPWLWKSFSGGIRRPEPCPASPTPRRPGNWEELLASLPVAHLATWFFAAVAFACSKPPGRLPKGLRGARGQHRTQQ
ncbi:PREDICTED: mas-related G-protein coupled receptor member H-like, partial [Cariama cristata]|uniref:mas-related G-protein coupled receptor member H-like n=1 Tax=Cariama cristata TaxID=54380 RepID=UPI000520E387